MSVPVCYHLKNNHFWLSAERIIYWEEQKAVIASDLHFGKTGHFRKHGIAVPQNVFKEDLQRLLAQLTFFKAEQLLVVGDMFHSVANKELDLFLRWRNDLSQLHINLIKGNHDILKQPWYEAASITTHESQLIIDGIGFQHDSEDNNCEMTNAAYTFCGHLHPGIIISGTSRQHLCFPCFHFGETHAVLPAFSRFTGLAVIKPKKGESVYAIVEKSVVKVK